MSPATAWRWCGIAKGNSRRRRRHCKRSRRTAGGLLKLGLCQQRHAGLLAQPPERAKMLASARSTYERLIQQFPKSEAHPQAIVERAKCLNRMGDPNTAANELRRFANDAQLK